MKNIDPEIMAKNAQSASDLLKACSNPERLMILCSLINTERSVGDLHIQSTLSQSAFSQHLAVLRRAGLVHTRKEMQTVYYSIADENVHAILELLNKLFCK